MEKFQAPRYLSYIRWQRGFQQPVKVPCLSGISMQVRELSVFLQEQGDVSKAVGMLLTLCSHPSLRGCFFWRNSALSSAWPAGTHEKESERRWVAI